MSEGTVIVDQPTGLVDGSGNKIESWTPPKNGDVMKHAKKKCKGCRGAGFIKTWVYARAMPCENIGMLGHRVGICAKECRCERDTQVKVPQVCACAVKGWEKKNGVSIKTGKPLEKITRDSFTGRPLNLKVQVNG